MQVGTIRKMDRFNNGLYMPLCRCRSPTMVAQEMGQMHSGRCCVLPLTKGHLPLKPMLFDGINAQIGGLFARPQDQTCSFLQGIGVMMRLWTPQNLIFWAVQDRACHNCQQFKAESAVRLLAPACVVVLQPRYEVRGVLPMTASISRKVRSLAPICWARNASICPV